MRPLCIAVLLISSSVYQQCDADSSGFVDKGGGQSNQHFTQMEPAKQAALFRASFKQRISDRLTWLFDSSTNTEHARQLAKDSIRQHIKEIEDAQNQGHRHEQQAPHSPVPDSASKNANDMINQYMKELRDAQDQKHLHEEKDPNTSAHENLRRNDVYFYAGC
jgi:hypothetical protein